MLLANKTALVTGGTAGIGEAIALCFADEGAKVGVVASRDLDKAEQLQNAGFKLCIVSPELQGRGSLSQILDFRNQIQLLGIKGDAVCTKHADLWA